MRKTITLITIILTLTMTTLTAYADPFPNNIEILTQYGDAPYASVEAEDVYKDDVVFINKNGIAYANAELMAGILGGDMDVDLKSGTCQFSVGDGNWYTACAGQKEVTVEDFEGLKSTVSLNHAPIARNGKLCLPVRDFAEKVWNAKVGYEYDDGLHKIYITIID